MQGLLVDVSSYIERNCLLHEGDRVVVGVSGGADSLCLLHLLRVLAPTYSLQLIVAHLNHCLRPEAGSDMAFVRGVAEKWGFPFEGEALRVRRYSRRHGLTEEEGGRLLRRSFLARIATRHEASVIALGHQRDDQAETVLLRLIRGSGVDGLAGMAPCSNLAGFSLVRPLLGIDRGRIEEYCRQEDLLPRVDSSNLQGGYTRNRIRLELLPFLEKRFNPGIKNTLVSFAGLAAGDRDYFSARAEDCYNKLARDKGAYTALDRKGLRALHPALRGRVLRLALARKGGLREVGYKHIALIDQLLEGGETGCRLDLPGSRRALLSYDQLLVGLLPTVTTSLGDPLTLPLPGQVQLPGGKAICARVCPRSEAPTDPGPYRACLDYDRVGGGLLLVRGRRRGDRFYPQGAPGTKSLKDFFIDQKVPASERPAVPLVTSEKGTILWVAGLRIAHCFRITPATKRVLVLEQRDG